MLGADGPQGSVTFTVDLDCRFCVALYVVPQLPASVVLRFNSDEVPVVVPIVCENVETRHMRNKKASHGIDRCLTATTSTPVFCRGPGKKACGGVLRRTTDAEKGRKPFFFFLCVLGDT